MSTTATNDASWFAPDNVNDGKTGTYYWFSEHDAPYGNLPIQNNNIATFQVVPQRQEAIAATQTVSASSIIPA